MKSNNNMKNITYNVKNYFTILDNLQNFTAWELFDKLGKMLEYAGVTSPNMLNQAHCKQPRDTRELYLYRKAGKTPTFKVGARRGYTAITFEF